MESRIIDASRVSQSALLSNQLPIDLRALGRLTEALDPMRAELGIECQTENLETCRHPRQQPERAGADAGRGGRGGGGRRAVRDLRRPQRRCVSADEQAHDPRRRPAPGGPPDRGGDALPRGRANAEGAPARLPAALLAAGFQLLRPAPRRPRARRVATSLSIQPSTLILQLLPTLAAPSPSARRRRSSG